MSADSEDKELLLSADPSDEHQQPQTACGQNRSTPKNARTTVRDVRRAVSRRRRRLRCRQRERGFEPLALSRLSASIDRLAAAIEDSGEQAVQTTPPPSPSFPEPTELDRARMRRQKGMQTSYKPADLQASTLHYYSQHDSPLGKEAHLRAVREGKLPGFKPHSKMVLVRKADMDAFIAAHRCKPIGKGQQVQAEHRDADEFLKRIGLDDGQK